MNILAYFLSVTSNGIKSIGHLYYMELTEPFMFSFLASLWKKCRICGAWISSLIWNALRNCHITMALCLQCSTRTIKFRQSVLHHRERKNFNIDGFFFFLSDVQTFLIGESSQVNPRRSKQSPLPILSSFQHLSMPFFMALNYCPFWLRFYLKMFPGLMC